MVPPSLPALGEEEEEEEVSLLGRGALEMLPFPAAAAARSCFEPFPAFSVLFPVTQHFRLP